MTAMDEELIQAYAETHYTVQDKEPFVLHIGEVSEALLACHKRNRVECCAFITAWNPLSQQLSATENEERHQALMAEIKSRSLSFLPGEGKHPSNNWPAEQSVLVMGLSLEAAKTLGRRFEQNAVVWADEAGIPQLVVLSATHPTAKAEVMQLDSFATKIDMYLNQGFGLRKIAELIDVEPSALYEWLRMHRGMVIHEVRATRAIVEPRDALIPFVPAPKK